MPFNPHTPEDVGDMLAAIGAKKHRRPVRRDPERAAHRVAGGHSGRAQRDADRPPHDGARRAGRHCRSTSSAPAPTSTTFPSAVWAVTTRGEFYSAYTPYQAEASQGTLQLIYEYQTMISSLTGMEVSNASLYDGGSAVAEASLMAVRAHRKSKSQRILVPTTVHPNYRKVARGHGQRAGRALRGNARARRAASSVADLEKYEGEDITAIVIQQPNFFGVLEDVDALTDWAHANGMLVIALGESDLARASSSRRASGARRAPTSPAATASRSACRCPRAVRTRASSPRKHGIRAPDAGPHRRPHGRRRRQAGLRAHAAGARAAHPPRQGDVEHLHQPGPAGHGGDDLPELVRARGPCARRQRIASRAPTSSSPRSRASRA